MRVMDNENMAKILSVLKGKQDLALKEFDRTDLNKIVHYKTVQRWFLEIQRMIRNKPPAQCVRCLHIYEDGDGNVLRIEYEYTTTGANAFDISICIHELI